MQPFNYNRTTNMIMKMMMMRKLLLPSLFILLFLPKNSPADAESPKGNEEWIINGEKEGEKGMVSYHNQDGNNYPSSSAINNVLIISQSRDNDVKDDVTKTMTNSSKSRTVKRDIMPEGSPSPKKVERTYSRFRPDQTICLNATRISKAVYQSEVVFAGKILQLYEQMQATTSTTASTSNTESANEFYLTAKRRRESYFGDRFARRIKSSSPIQQQLKPFPRYEAIVLIKTVYKGSKGLEDSTVKAYVDPNELSKLGNGKNLIRCVRRLRALDTRLFFYKSVENYKEKDKDKDGQQHRQTVMTMNVATAPGTSPKVIFQPSALTFWPVPPTLLVLDAIRFAVKGKRKN